MRIVRVAFFFLAMAASLAFVRDSAYAGCSNRPGTPDLVKAESLSKGNISFSWRSTQREGGKYFDLEISDNAGRVLQNIAGFDSGPGVRYHEWASWTSPWGAGVERCFRVRARTAGGTQGCVSKIWSGKACGVALSNDPPTAGTTGPNKTSPPSSAKGDAPLPPRCQFTAKVVVGQCLNLDGTPSTYLDPGSRSAPGCGATKDDAIAAAKKAIFATETCLYDDEPVATCCSYKVEYVTPGCNCTTVMSSKFGKCGGDKPSGTWPFCCPANHSYGGGVCRKISRLCRSAKDTNCQRAVPLKVDGLWQTRTADGVDYLVDLNGDAGKGVSGSLKASDPKRNGSFTGTRAGNVLMFTFKLDGGQTGKGGWAVVGDSKTHIGARLVGNMTFDGSPSKIDWTGTRAAAAASRGTVECSGGRVRDAAGNCKCPSGQRYVRSARRCVALR